MLPNSPRFACQSIKRLQTQAALWPALICIKLQRNKQILGKGSNVMVEVL